jgi:diadenylate cyclase
METFALQIATLKEMLNWRVSLDILLIAAGIYALYRTLRSLGTWKTVTGVFIAVLIFLVARFLGLKGIDWIFSNFIHVALLALIIIFQPEIRKIFERAASLRREELGEEGTGLASDLSKVVFSLGEQRRGGILVFPGKEAIQPWISEGTVLDAEPSFPLILSIFDPHSPGHDGAMVIENGQIRSFGVRLPLSKSETLSETFGTRHHAAMGLSEMTDALVVTVSEERGTTTVFHRGVSWKPKNKNELADRIRAHWAETSSYALPIRRAMRLRAHLGSVSLSLFLAFLFWSTVVISQTEIREKGFTVPIEYVTADNVALVGTKLAEMKVHLAGPKSELDLVDPSQFAVRIDLSKAGPGKQTVLVTEENFKLPKLLKLLDVEPPALEVALREIEERVALVKPQLVGHLPAGLKMISIFARPPTIHVLAPEASHGETAPSVTTTPIYLDSIRESTTILCKIIAPPSVRPAQKRWPDVEVEINVSAP